MIGLAVASLSLSAAVELRINGTSYPGLTNIQYNIQNQRITVDSKWEVNCTVGSTSGNLLLQFGGVLVGLSDAQYVNNGNSQILDVTVTPGSALDCDSELLHWDRFES